MRIGIDLGGTKTEGIALAADGAELARRRLPTPRDDYAATLRAIGDLVAALEAEAGARGSVGLGIPGAISPASGLIKNANSTWLNGQPLKEDLEAALGRPVRLANDANCFALSEAVDGAGAGRDVVFGVILGTGVGAGIVVHGRVLEGPNAIAGEWGHNPLPWPGDHELPGPACYCGLHGCIETFLSGPALARQYEELTGERLATEDILAGGGDRAGEVRATFEERLARALAHVVNILDPDVIVLGGGLSNHLPIYEAVPRLWGAHIFSDHVATELRRAAHGDSSGVRGAAWLWPAEGEGTGAAGDAERSRIRKHSVDIAGHRTSVSLEDAFWRILRGAAAEQGCSLNALVTEIDAGRTAAGAPPANLSATLRLYALDRVAAGRPR